MSIQNFTLEAQAAIDMRYGASDTAARAAEDASFIAQSVAEHLETLPATPAANPTAKGLPGAPSPAT